MTENTDFDVAIVGASIAGCTAATFLGRQGARVALVESHSDPHSYKRMCTHVFQASASPTIRRLGILETLERAGARESGVNIWSRYGWISPSRAYMDQDRRGRRRTEHQAGDARPDAAPRWPPAPTGSS